MALVYSRALYLFRSRNTLRCCITSYQTSFSTVEHTLTRTLTLVHAPNANQVSSVRHYSFRNTGKNSKAQSNKETDEEDDDEVMDIDRSISEDVDGKNVKLVKARLNSLRLDTVLKAGLGTSKSKIETAFYESKIRVNGEKVLKKSKQLHVGDEIDLTTGPNSLNENFLDISRVIIVSAQAGDNDEDKLRVVLKRYKQLVVESYKSTSRSVEE